MPGNVGTQTVTVKYFDSVNNPIVNNIGLDVRKVGIYSGGYLTRVNDTTVSLSTFTCEIADSGGSGNQVRCSTASTVGSITVGVATPYVVLRWTYTGSSANDYVDFVAVASGGILSTDVVVGLCVFVGSVLQTTFDYTLRTNPNVMDLFLKVEPTSPASMYVRIRAGRVSYGSANYDVADQISPLMAAPGSNSWIYILQVDTTGTVVVSHGTAAASPTAPDYAGLVTLAQITIATGQTTITSTSIKDVRDFITPTLGTVLENRTSDPASPATGRMWLRTDL